MNTFIESNTGKHFTLSDRISIEAGIEKGWSFKKIADELGKSPSSVSFCPSFTTAKCELLKKPPFFLILNMKKAVDHK